MKLVSYKTENLEHIGLSIQGHIYNLHSCDKLIPDNMNQFLLDGEVMLERAMKVHKAIVSGEIAAKEEVFFELLAPVPHPASCRDAYAFRQHVESARRNRRLGMIAEFDQYPVFYYTNHNAIMGPGDIACMPDHFEKLDFELEVAIVIGKKGRNIRAEDADGYIAGFTIMNDLSARTLQMEEMILNLGPAKGKDFATVIGPWLVTPDELTQYLIPPKGGHIGNNYNLTMKCRVNEKEVSSGNMGDMEWTFAEIIERCSYGVDLYPGDVIGSGTVGTGCFLELNGTATLNNPDFKPQWLQPGDLIEMEVSGLGRLITTVTKSATDWSILKRKKNLINA